MAASTFYSPITPTGTGTGVVGQVAYVRAGLPVMNGTRYAYPIESPAVFTGVPTLGQVWPRSRTTIVEEGMDQETADALYVNARVVTTISTDTALAASLNTDYVYLASAALTATLPTAAGNSGVYTVKRTGTGTVTIATTAGQTVDGAATMVLGTQYESVDLVSNGTGWVVI